ncbi:MAG TPA: cytochrome c [Holophagaceae bacterium]|nr:cytochrome c [Holophagaceae bacterium]
MSAMLLLLSGMVSVSQAPRKDLALFYRRACAECHGADGGARSPSGLRLAGRNLSDYRWQARTTDADMVKVILKGKREMPAFGASLSGEDAQRLVTEILRPMAARKG